MPGLLLPALPPVFLPRPLYPPTPYLYAPSVSLLPPGMFPPQPDRPHCPRFPLPLPVPSAFRKSPSPRRHPVPVPALQHAAALPSFPLRSYRRTLPPGFRQALPSRTLPARRCPVDRRIPLPAPYVLQKDHPASGIPLRQNPRCLPIHRPPDPHSPDVSPPRPFPADPGLPDRQRFRLLPLYRPLHSLSVNPGRQTGSLPDALLHHASPHSRLPPHSLPFPLPERIRLPDLQRSPRAARPRLPDLKHPPDHSQPSARSLHASAVWHRSSFLLPIRRYAQPLRHVLPHLRPVSSHCRPDRRLHWRAHWHLWRYGPPGLRARSVRPCSCAAYPKERPPGCGSG